MNNLTCHLPEIYTILQTIRLQYEQFRIPIHVKNTRFHIKLTQENNITCNLPEIITIDHIVDELFVKLCIFQVNGMLNCS